MLQITKSGHFFFRMVLADRPSELLDASKQVHHDSDESDKKRQCRRGEAYDSKPHIFAIELRGFRCRGNDDECQNITRYTDYKEENY